MALEGINLIERKTIMTYSQRSTYSSASSDITHLEVQIEVVKEEIEQAKSSSHQQLLDTLIQKLADLEAELAKFED